jgi:hypothetical protein
MPNVEFHFHYQRDEELHTSVFPMAVDNALLRNLPIPDEKRVSTLTTAMLPIVHAQIDRQLKLTDDVTKDCEAAVELMSAVAHLYHHKEAKEFKSEVDPLLYIRECEEAECSLSPFKSDFVKSSRDNFTQQVVISVKQKFSHTDTLFFGEFASGGFQRALQVVEGLKNIGIIKFKFLFVDIGYRNLIKLLNGEELAFAEKIVGEFQFRAIKQLGAWMGENLDSPDAKEAPIEIHIADGMMPALQFLEKAKQKLEVLVAQDYDLAEESTPHSDFMRMVHKGLEGCFFELVKDDEKDRIYFHRGSCADGKYKAEMGVIYEPLHRKKILSRLSFLAETTIESTKESIFNKLRFGLI